MSLLAAAAELDARIADICTESSPWTVVRTATAGRYLDRSRGCRAALLRVVADDGPAVAAAAIQLGFDAYAGGDWRAARRWFAAGAERALSASLVRACRFGAALLASATGDVDTVRRAADALTADERRDGSTARYAGHLRALVARSAGEHAVAFDEFAAVAASSRLVGAPRHALWILLDTVECALAAGRRADAVAYVDAMRAGGVADLSPRYASVVAAGFALVADTDARVSHFEAALAVPDLDRWPFDHGRVRLLFGEHLRRRRATEAARVQLRAAEEIFARLGAQPWRARAQAALRVDGEHRFPVDVRTIVLTAHQLRVAELAAAGLTNKEIAARCGSSHRGVGTILYRLFPALRISSRTALADALAHHDVRLAE